MQINMSIINQINQKMKENLEKVRQSHAERLQRDKEITDTLNRIMQDLENMQQAE